jgi:hypothetical protein
VAQGIGPEFKPQYHKKKKKLKEPYSYWVDILDILERKDRYKPVNGLNK